MRRLQSFSFLPRVLPEVFDVAKKITDRMADAKCDCDFFLDEMEIAAGIEHDGSQDCFLGTVTIPSKNVPANHALVFMVGV